MTSTDQWLIAEHEFLTTDEVLEYLRINARTVYRLIRNGEIPAVRIGRQWRIRRNDLDRWLETQRPVAAK
jgi:excisionase family DNA binding protein